MLRLNLGTTNPDVYIDLQSIYINPMKSATITYALVNFKTGGQQQTYEMNGEQYAKWGTDDIIIYHLLCARHNLQYKPFEEPEFFEEIMVWRDEKTNEMKSELIKKLNPKYDPNKKSEEYKPLTLPVLLEDIRSVHNDADVAKIETLQTQLDEQQKKLKTITDLLINKGMI